MSDEPRDERDPLELFPDFHRSTRMPLDAVVRLHFEGTVAYQNGFAANVSALGMFVKHPDPPDIGTRLVFEFVLGDERKPVQGAGVVAWVRDKYEGPGRPAGVGIQFTELDALSRQHISEALFEYLEAQLGVEVADHPDVPDLLAAVPSRASDSAEIASEQFAVEADAAAEESGLPTDWSASETEEEPPPLPSFKPFGETVEDDDGFEPVVPPDPDASPAGPSGEPDEAFYGRATESGGGQSTFRIGLVAALVVIAIGLGWYFLLGPGAAAPAPEVGTAEPEPAPRAEPLPATVAGEATLAEAIGVESPGVEDDAASDESTGESAPAAEPPPAPAAEPAPAPAAEPVVVSAPAASRRQATDEPSRARIERLVDLAWDSSPGATFVTLTGDGPFVSGTYRYFEMPGAEPRILVRLTGVLAGYPRPVVDVGTTELRRIRTGFHEKPAGNELHVVLDLAPGAALQSVDVAENRLVVRLGGSED